MITSTLSSKAQTTIPQPVRAALGLREGDQLGYVIEKGRAVLTRVEPAAVIDDPFLLFSEWNGDADARAFAGL